jgi:hypothetical protein
VRRELESAFPQFAVLADIANAGKHLKLARGPRVGMGAEHFVAGRGAAFSDGSYYSDGTSHSDAPLVVRAEFSGEQIDVYSLCRRLLIFLEASF